MKLSVHDLCCLKKFIQSIKSADQFQSLSTKDEISYNLRKYEEVKRILSQYPNQHFYIVYNKKIGPSDDHMFLGCFTLYTENEFKELCPFIDKLLQLDNNGLMYHRFFIKNAPTYLISENPEEIHVSGIADMIMNHPNLIPINYDKVEYYKKLYQQLEDIFSDELKFSKGDDLFIQI
jgi:hypothetical protein